MFQSRTARGKRIIPAISFVFNSFSQRSLGVSLSKLNCVPPPISEFGFRFKKIVVIEYAQHHPQEKETRGSGLFAKYLAYSIFDRRQKPILPIHSVSPIKIFFEKFVDHIYIDPMNSVTTGNRFPQFSQSEPPVTNFMVIMS